MIVYDLASICQMMSCDEFYEAMADVGDGNLVNQIPGIRATPYDGRNLYRHGTPERTGFGLHSGLSRWVLRDTVDTRRPDAVS